MIFNYKFQVKVYKDRQDMGKYAAIETAQTIKEMLKKQDELNMVFAAAPSQNEFFANLIQQDIEWNRINAFHMDEYIGLPKGHPARFSEFLCDHIFNKVGFKNIFIIDGDNDPEKEIMRYSSLIKSHKIHITCMGIGENGHIAFNDPHAARFDDDKLVKIVDLDEKCRMQQVHDGCFKTLDMVPKYALTLTIPALMSAQKIFCIVPGDTKAAAVKNTVLGSVTERCPASILRRHTDASLYLDKDSAKYLK